MAILGRTRVYGFCGDDDISALSIGSGRLIETVDSSGTHKQYLTSDSQSQDGILLSSGNYANPIKSDASFNDAIYNQQTGTTYTLQPSDRGKTVRMNNAAANTVTIDTNANQAIPVSSVVIVGQKGVGQTTIQAVSGVSLNGVDGGSVTISAQYKSAVLDQESADVWWCEGAI